MKIAHITSPYVFVLQCQKDRTQKTESPYDDLYAKFKVYYLN